MRITKSELKNVFLGAVIGIIATGIWDIFKNIPIFSTFKNLKIWIWNHVFKFEFSVLQILVLVILFFFIKQLIKYFSNFINKSSGFLNYTKDNFDKYNWKWDWIKKSGGQYYVDNLKILCDKCETPMNFEHSFHRAECPRCNYIINDYKNLNDVEAVIIDNLNRKKLQIEKKSNISLLCYIF